MAEAAAMSHAMPIGHVPYAGIMAEASAIKQRLGQTGILAAVRAQLREAVLQAMTSGKLDDATEMFGFDDPCNDENINPSPGSALGAADLLAVALVDDFLHVHGCTRSQEALRDELVGYHARPSRAETVQQLWPGRKPPVHTDAEPLLLHLLPAHVRPATNDQDVMHSDRLLSALPGACHSREGAHGAASKDFLAAERAAATSQNTFNTAPSAAPAASPTAAVAAAPIAAPAAGIARASLFAAAPTTAAQTVTAPAITTKSNPAPSNSHAGAFREETKDDPTSGDVKNTCAPAPSARFSQLPTPWAAAAPVASQSSSASPSLLGALPPVGGMRGLGGKPALGPPVGKASNRPEWAESTKAEVLAAKGTTDAGKRMANSVDELSALSDLSDLSDTGSKVDQADEASAAEPARGSARSKGLDALASSAGSAFSRRKGKGSAAQINGNGASETGSRGLKGGGGLGKGLGLPPPWQAEGDGDSVDPLEAMTAYMRSVEEKGKRAAEVEESEGVVAAGDDVLEQTEDGEKGGDAGDGAAVGSDDGGGSDGGSDGKDDDGDDDDDDDLLNQLEAATDSDEGVGLEDEVAKRKGDKSAAGAGGGGPSESGAGGDSKAAAPAPARRFVLEAESDDDDDGGVGIAHSRHDSRLDEMEDAEITRNGANSSVGGRHANHSSRAAAVSKGGRPALRWNDDDDDDTTPVAPQSLPAASNSPLHSSFAGMRPPETNALSGPALFSQKPATAPAPAAKPPAPAVVAAPTLADDDAESIDEIESEMEVLGSSGGDSSAGW